MGRPKGTVSGKRVMLYITEPLHTKAKAISPKGTFSDGVRVALEAYGANVATLKGFDADGKPVGVWKK